MAVVKQFHCDQCDAEGKISIKGDDVTLSDIAVCPVCGSSIYDEEMDSED